MNTGTKDTVVFKTIQWKTITIHEINIPLEKIAQIYLLLFGISGCVVWWLWSGGGEMCFGGCSGLVVCFWWWGPQWWWCCGCVDMISDEYIFGKKGKFILCTYQKGWEEEISWNIYDCRLCNAEDDIYTELERQIDKTTYLQYHDKYSLQDIMKMLQEFRWLSTVTHDLIWKSFINWLFGKINIYSIYFHCPLFEHQMFNTHTLNIKEQRSRTTSVLLFFICPSTVIAFQ